MGREKSQHWFKSKAEEQEDEAAQQIGAKKEEERLGDHEFRSIW